LIVDIVRSLGSGERLGDANVVGVSLGKASAVAGARLTVRVLVLAWLLSLTGCTKLGYIRQASAGQYDLVARARSIDELVVGEHVDGKTRRWLSHVAPIKKFGERYGLAATDNYRKYVRLDRPYVVWVTSASDPLQFKSRSWSFPFVGSFTYLGWFDRHDADAFASGVRAEGLDVDVRGSGAYSTAGFFEDAVLSTMMRNGKSGFGEMTNTILHESAHATFFVRDQSTLNESVANFLGDRLAEMYLREALGPTADETTAYLASEQVQEARGRALRAAYRTLEALYASAQPDAVKLAEKSAILARLRADTTFKRPINNATLIQYNTYNSGQEELALLLRECGGSFPRFIATLKTLESKALPKRQEKDVGTIVRPLIAAKCT
jgi:predicted aminopeptidase